MEAWKLCNLIVKIVILTVGYSGILINTEPNHHIYREIMEQSLSAEECFAYDSYLSNPESIKIILENQQENNIWEAIDKEEEEALSDIGQETSIEAEARDDSDKEAELGQEPIEAAENLDESYEEEADLPEPSEETESRLNSDPVFTAEVKAIVEKSLKQYPLNGTLGLYIRELESGNEFGINEELTYYDESDGNTDGYFRAASVVKLQIAYAAFRLMEKGELDPEATWVDPVTKKELSLLPTLHRMVSRSDNDLFNSMLRFIGKEKVNSTLDEYGIINSNVYGEISPAIGYSSKNNLERHGTSKVGGKITPRDMGIILEAVYREKETNKYMNMLNEALLANIYNSRIPRGINNKYPVAHKTGTSDDFGVYNDAGIIYGETPYILVVLTKGESSSKAHGFIRLLSKELTDYMDNRK